ncbi:MAG: hypothetical protein AMS16_01590 [Planctomycetes bacterium DG_58]|nr:MAG: hypothetical protein AMS16_01590 [Planctomycetes bacterium DG_58]KPL04854.1 MAG: hypothetical protein AMK75_00340 [Planctomycetes bacterium SM23_65]
MTDLLSEVHTNDKCRVLIVDDDEDFAQSLADILQSHGYPCAVAPAAEDACSVDEHFDAQVALVDVCLGTEDGLDLVAELRQTKPDTLCVLMSAYAELESAMRAVREGAHAYLRKPIDGDDLLATLESCFETVQLRQEKAEAEKALESANAQLERKNKRLAELREAAERFVDDVSHEFRSPLAVIKEFASILADGLAGPVTDEQAKYLGIVANAVEDLTDMVNDLLDSSRIESSLRRVDRRRCQITEIIRSVRPMLMKRAAGKNITIVEDIVGRLSDVFADGEKVGRVLINLVVNAVKFSPENSQVTVWARKGRYGRTEVGVTDQGRGLSKEELKVIFDRFRRIDNATGMNTRGFGLGLHITKELVWLNLGTVHVESTLGEGSTFSFTLPGYDRRVILDSYFGLLNEFHEPTVVSALAVVPQNAECSLADIHGFLISECRPMDLVLDDEKGDGLVLLGWTDTPEDWARRIRAARETSLKNAPLLQLPEMRMMTIGTWTCPEQSQEAVETLLEALSGRMEVAQESACD